MNGSLINWLNLYPFPLRLYTDDSRWETVARTTSGPLQEFTVSFQSLLPSTAYTFRVISYNKYGISYPVYSKDAVLTPSKLYLEYGYLQHKPFYRRTWFMVALAAASIVIIIMVIAVLCVKSKSYRYKRKYTACVLLCCTVEFHCCNFACRSDVQRRRKKFSKNQWPCRLMIDKNWL